MKTMMRSFLFAAVLAIGSTGCYRMTIQQAESMVNPPKMFVEFQDGGKWSHYTLWGIVPIKRGDVEAVCGSKSFDTLHMRTTFLNALVGQMVSIAYMPQTFWVDCGEQAEK
ncbi:MAG: hypothetical protein D6761_13065 [Candidatus Dadabacteria bacterium]|nr:MAG: hypothetical protein D6761_13065 [Candidatus Dadabacteria bacterium]